MYKHSQAQLLPLLWSVSEDRRDVNSLSLCVGHWLLHKVYLIHKQGRILNFNLQGQMIKTWGRRLVADGSTGSKWWFEVWYDHLSLSTWYMMCHCPLNNILSKFNLSVKKRLWTELLPCFLNRPNIPAWLSLVQTARLRSEEWLRAVSVIHMPINSLAISIRGVTRKAPTIKVRHMSHTVELVISPKRRLTTFEPFHVLYMCNFARFNLHCSKITCSVPRMKSMQHKVNKKCILTVSNRA